MSSSGEDKCLFCYQITNSQPLAQQFQTKTKDVLTTVKIDKISSAVCSILNLPNCPYEEIIKSSIICPACLGVLNGVEKILSDLEFIQKKVIKKRSQLEAQLINSAKINDDDQGGERSEDSLTSRNRRKIVEKIKSWDNLDTSELASSANFNDLIPYDHVEAILNLDSIKKEQDNNNVLRELESDPDFEDHFLNPSPSSSTGKDQNQNNTGDGNDLRVKPCNVVVVSLDLPLEYLSATFDVNEDFIQSYIRQDSKIVLRAHSNTLVRQFNTRTPKNDFQEDNGSNSNSSDDELSCTKCNFSARSEHGLKLHIVRLHNRRGKRFKSSLKKVQKNDNGDQNLQNDESSNFLKQSRVKEIPDQEEIIKCDECQEYLTFNLVDLHLHKLKEHTKTQDYYICPICKKKIKLRVKFRDHLQLHNSRKPFACHCGLTFKLQRYLKDHELNLGHNRKKKNAEEISEDEERDRGTEKRNRHRFKRSTPADDKIREAFYSSLQNHDPVIEDKSVEFSCTENCGFKDSNVLKYYSHILKIHGTREGFKCPIMECRASIKMGQKFKQHLQIHKIKNKPFACTIDGCEAKFAIIDYLQSHMSRGHGINMRRTGPKELNQGHKKVEYNDNAEEIDEDRDEKNARVTEKRKARFSDFGVKKKLRERSTPTPADEGIRKAFYSSLNNHAEVIEDENLEYICTEKCGFKDRNELEYYSHIVSIHDIREGFKCPIMECGKMIKMGRKFKKHLKIHKIKNKPFDCIIDRCEAKFAIIDYLHDHMIRTHGISMRRPGSIKKNIKFRTRENNAEEINENEESDPGSVIEKRSPYRFKSSTPADDEIRDAFYSSLKNHDPVIEDEDLEFICTENCGFSQTNALEYYSHILKIHGIKGGFKCPIVECGAILKMRQKFRQHLQIHKIKNKPFACTMDGCDAKFATIDYLQSHMARGHGISMARSIKKRNRKRKLASPTEKIFCEVCGKIFFSRSKYNDHYSKIHDDSSEAQTHFCEICGKNFSTLNYLTSHQRYHGIGKPLLCCELCEFKTINSVGLKIHINTVHLGRKDFICDMCPQTFARKTNLKEHIKCKHKESASHVELEFECDVCLKRFSLQSGLRNHKRACSRAQSSQSKSLDKKKYPCPEPGCKEEYTRNSALKRHIAKIHTKNLKISCPHCEKRFFDQYVLNRHLMTKHKYDKPFKCEFCGRGFTIGHYLKRHILQNHADDSEKLFKCLPCGKHYGIKESLYLHNKFHHPELLTQSSTSTAPNNQDSSTISSSGETLDQTQ